MSSEQRSNSAVRNLRSIFENKAHDSAKDARGRSPAGGTLSPDAQHEQPRPRSRVRASFIPVEPTMAAVAAEQQQNNPATEQKQNNLATEQKRESSVGLRRASMSEGHSGDALDLIKDTVSAEADRRDRKSSVAEIIPEQAVETPALEDNSKEMGAPPKVDKEPDNPDKPVTGEQEEPADMKPADPVSEQAVSGGEALPSVAEDLRKDTKATSSKTAAAKPSSISTKAPKTSSSIKSPPLSSTSSTKAPTKKPSRSSLTAPTAASVARAAAQDKQTGPAAAKPKPREPTKPMDVSSRLTAPTAASRARLESATNSTKPAPSSRPQPKPASAKPTPRPSLAGRPDSRASANATKKPAAPVDGSFLERMMRPTAASSQKTHEKTEVKSPPRQKQVPLRTKANGHAKSSKTAPAPKAAATGAAEPVEEATVVEDESILPQEDDIPPQTATAEAAVADVKDALNETPAEPAAAAAKDLNEGNETPAHTNGYQEDAPALEDTPAAIGGEDTIR